MLLVDDKAALGKFAQTLAIVAENTTGDPIENGMLSISICWRMGLAHANRSNIDDANKVYFKALTIDNNVRQVTQGRPTNPAIIGIRQLLIPNLIMLKQWQKAIIQAQCLIQDEHNCDDLPNIDIVQSLVDLIDISAKDTADDPEAVACCRQVIETLTPLLTAVENEVG
ncbi:MAG: hypothetical protein ACI9FJ_001385 [Alteromonadaceae bacterium]|jgi:hypothetical protein